MSTASNDKWAKAEASITAELLPILKLLKADYQAASNIHIPRVRTHKVVGMMSGL
jgi:hypothetical protein